MKVSGMAMLMAIFIYLAISFLAWDFNPGNWHPFVRFVGLFLWLVGLVAYLLGEEDDRSSIHRY